MAKMGMLIRFCVLRFKKLRALLKMFETCSCCSGNMEIIVEYTE